MEERADVSAAHYRMRGDALADTYFEKIHAYCETATGFRGLDFSAMETQPAPVQNLLEAYFHDVCQLPDWADLQRMANGSLLFKQFGPQIVVSLFCHALPACYCCASGAFVLANTGRMLYANADESHERYTNRIMETAQFLIDVMSPGAFVTGSGLRTIAKIRLMHAAIRFFLLRHDYQADVYGVPINQQDLLGTLMSFSYISLETLRKLGVSVDPAQQADFIHLWSVVGEVLGIDYALLPQTVSEAEHATTAILDSESRRSVSGEVLTRSLVHFIDRVLWRNQLPEFSGFMIRYLLGDARADLLGVKQMHPVLAALAVPNMRWVMRCYHHIVRNKPLLRRWIQSGSKQFLQSLVLHYAEKKRITFRIPQDFSDHWHL